MIRTAFLVVAALVTPSAQADGRLELKGFDRLVALGDRVVLEAKLEKVYSWWYHPDQEDAFVEFWLDGSKLGAAYTNDDGRARVGASAILPEGDHWVEVRHQPRKGASIKDHFLISVRPTQTPIAICDIDHTISDATAWEYVTRENEDIPTLPGAVQAVRELASQYQFVYLTARDDAFLRKTRDWLEYHGFPQAPILVWDLFGENPHNHGRYKARRIAEIKSRFPRIPVGFGDKDHDAKAYLEHGLRAYILPSEDRDHYPRKALLMPSWQAIVKHLLDNPIRRFL